MTHCRHLVLLQFARRVARKFFSKLEQLFKTVKQLLKLEENRFVLESDPRHVLLSVTREREREID